MTADGFKKAGLHWTPKGWKRTPKHLQTVKKATPPPKRRTRKKARIAAATSTEKPPTFAEARKLAAGKGRAVSAPTPPAKAVKPATPPPRKARSGKYADLDRPKGDP